jgi:hypothetical protein
MAQPGPDPCTGLGVPNGNVLLNLLISSHDAIGGKGTSASQAPGGSSKSVMQAVALHPQGNSNGAGAPRVSDSSYTGFALWRGNGLVNLQINDGNITADSRVFVSISEYSTDARINRFIGNAQMSILNVAPTNGAVHVLANVNWSSALNVRFDYFVDPTQV